MAAQLTDMQSPNGRFAEPRDEKVFNAPLIAVVLAVSMPVLFFFQQKLPDGGLSLAFVPADLGQGRLSGLVTALFLHGGWAHVGFNALSALCFAPPVARLFPGWRGVGIFLAFYIVSGVAGSAGYALVHGDSLNPLVGASGAVSGLMGAAIRLLGQRDGRVRPLRDRRVLTTATVLMAINAAVGLIGFAPGAEGATIAWEAHAFGFVFGLLAIGPLVTALGRPRSGFDPHRFDSPDNMGDRHP